ncbi:hypothetical protein M9Y10_043202 [Tritrichomonas musculus]|uniref:Uncharacterized protein n=1 Tax=Tritrichomonas musculus TaxID=1915356 RepID=A0ABR2JZG7_9EUKA
MSNKSSTCNSDDPGSDDINTSLPNINDEESIHELAKEISSSPEDNKIQMPIMFQVKKVESN